MPTLPDTQIIEVALRQFALDRFRSKTVADRANVLADKLERGEIGLGHVARIEEDPSPTSEILTVACPHCGEAVDHSSRHVIGGKRPGWICDPKPTEGLNPGVVLAALDSILDTDPKGLGPARATIMRTKVLRLRGHVIQYIA